MKKMLRMGDKILLTLALFGDVVIDMVQSGSKARRTGTLGFAELTPQEASKLSQCVRRLLRVGDIKREVKNNGRVFISLSPPGSQKLPSRRFSLVKLRQSWDGKWVVVSYDIPEKLKGTRAYLREKLISLGFARWQRSIYISPYSCFRADVKEWLVEHKLEDFVFVTAASDLSGGNERAFARGVFRLSDLAEEYRNLLDDFESEAISQEHFCQRFIEILLHDPYLPKQLLPAGWIGYKAEGQFGEILRVHNSLSIDRLMLTEN